ncbi:MAG: cobyrinate a,c-diamide synthase [Gluconacetobacter diazotrophicus]|nr:cobyrinate a,c-diamide synthase [Gluconacetobacter diazotrophicus]
MTTHGDPAPPSLERRAPTGLVIAAPRSGSGKTTVSLMLLGALRRRGLDVRAAKCGPDYVDPAFHAAATGHPSLNLDSWSMPPAQLDRTVADAVADGELLVVEAAMGLFDGVEAPAGRRGSAADIAARYRLPVVLVIDVSGQSQSVAAVARGFATHEPDVTVAGVILNRVASPRHGAQASEALRRAGIPVLGMIERGMIAALPERHLGLVQARESEGLPVLLDSLASAGESTLAIERIIALASPLPFRQERRHIGVLPPPGQRIAVADDDAFSFLYPHLVAGWRADGAELLFFSPLADEPPPAGADCCWLPGGYPELHAARLAAAERFRTGLARFAETRPVHGECGGYMVLGDALVDGAGTTHRMTGLLRLSTSFDRRRLHLGYREVTLLEDNVLGPAGTRMRGHEFHYATEIDRGDAPLVEARDAAGTVLGSAGSRRELVSGSFFHVIARKGSA